MIPRILIILLIAGTLTGILLYSQTRKPPAKVSGFIEAYEIRVGSRVGGRIAKIAVIEGAAVKTGDLLIELEPFDLHQKIAEAQGLLAQRQAQLTRVETGARPEEIAEAQAHRDQLKANLDKLVAGPRPEEIAQAQALSDQAISQQKLAQQNYDRVSKAFSTKTASGDEMDQATNQLQVAQATLTVRAQQLELLKEGNRREDVDAAKAQLAEADQALALLRNGSRAEDIAAAKAAVDTQQAVIAALNTQLAELKITAPAEGTIEAVDIRPGDLLSPNAPALTLLESTEHWVRAYIPENMGITPGDQINGKKVRVTVDAYPGKNFEGTVTFIAREAEFTPSNVQTEEQRSKQVFRIRVTLADPEHLLRAGMSADVWLDKMDK